MKSLSLPSSPFRRTALIPNPGWGGIVTAITLAVACSLHAQLVPAGIVYGNDFEGPVGSEWSIRQTDLSPKGTFLGQFADNDTVVLSLESLPPHTNLVLAFDLFILKSWDGNRTVVDGQTIGPDIWDLRLVGSTNPILRTTFGNDAAYNQAYPGSYPGGRYEARTGAAENNTMGFARVNPTGNSTIRDSIYRLSFRIPHTDSTVKLQFSSAGLQSADDESWGLDNVAVGTSSAPNVSLDVGPSDGGFWGPGNEFAAAPAMVVLRANAADTDDGVALVEFLANGLKIGEVAQSPFEFRWPNVAAGHYSVVARSVDSSGVSSTSIPRVLRVQPSLVPTGSVWRFLDSDPGADWSMPEFDDSLWSVGTARFGRGRGDETTLINSGNGRVTTYFRHSFRVSDASQYTRPLWLRLLRDDGAVVFLNGTEVFRSNMPTGEVSAVTLATRILGDAEATRVVMTQIAPGLATGTNVIAVELHSAATNTSDAAFDLSLASSETEIITQPADQVVARGGGAFFAASFASAGSRSFQWMHNDAEISGQTNASLILSNAQPEAAGRYQLIVTQGAETTFSVPAVLTVLADRQVFVESTFDQSQENWAVWDSDPSPRAPITHLSAGGNPGGYLSADEPGNGDGDTTFWQAPGKFLGNHSAAIGGLLQYDLRQNARSAQYGHISQDLILRGGGMTLAFDAPYNPATGWTAFRVPLLPGRWRVRDITGRTASLEELSRVLASLTEILIRAEFREGNDINSLDNVRLIAGPCDGLTPLFASRPANGSVTIQWPASRTCLQLEASSDLTSANWNADINTIAAYVTNGLNTVIVPTADGSRFYRLVNKD